MAILDRQPPAEMARRLDAVARGRDPDAPDGTGHEPIPWELRWKAQLALMERALGRVSERVSLDGTLRHAVTGAVSLHVIDPRDLLEALGEAGVDSYLDMQRKVAARARAKLAEVAE